MEKGKPNVELLEAVKARILAEPRQFAMDRFFTSEGVFRSLIRLGGCDAYRESIPNCGTAACIAGWAIAIKGGQTPAQAREEERSDTWEMAAEALRLTPGQASRLFLVSGWPLALEQAYRRAITPTVQAEIAARRIDLFIKTGS